MNKTKFLGTFSSKKRQHGLQKNSKSEHPKFTLSSFKPACFVWQRWEHKACLTDIWLITRYSNTLRRGKHSYGSSGSVDTSSLTCLGRLVGSHDNWRAPFSGLNWSRESRTRMRGWSAVARCRITAKCSMRLFRSCRENTPYHQLGKLLSNRLSLLKLWETYINFYYLFQYNKLCCKQDN